MKCFGPERLLVIDEQAANFKSRPRGGRSSHLKGYFVPQPGNPRVFLALGLLLMIRLKALLNVFHFTILWS